MVVSLIVIQSIEKQPKQMKLSIGTPTPTQIFQQKLLYQTHLRKLDQIRQDRRHQLTTDFSRNVQHQQIRHIKSRSFAHRYNQQHQQITHSNIKLLDRLEKVRPFARHTSFSEYQEEDRLHRATSAVKKSRLEQTQKENTRLYVRMKSVSSSLSKDKLLKDYTKSQQIKQRIARYASQNKKVYLKSEKLVQTEKKNLASHYRADEILKKKVENTFNQNKKASKQDSKSQNGASTNYNPGVFATQPQKVQSRLRKKIYI